ncbi:COMM domain-containing protein [Trichinella spiralis]|uniref:COMM domain-containing protein n=1 Tax=Trichinella spiralis TaxID=6334 RepID=A0ABR3K2W7_TRISP
MSALLNHSPAYYSPTCSAVNPNLINLEEKAKLPKEARIIIFVVHRLWRQQPAEIDALRSSEQYLPMADHANRQWVFFHQIYRY